MKYNNTIITKDYLLKDVPLLEEFLLSSGRKTKLRPADISYFRSSFGKLWLEQPFNR
jgi:hypothetical protein